MRDASELNSMIDAAEQAGAAGDWVSAEELLRQTLTAQESQFGPVHPELANTLNNLAVACEKTGKVDEAEQCYRRAYTIVRALLPSSDPLVVTSGENLREFCEARGRPFDQTPAPVTVTAQPEVEVVPEAPSIPRHETTSGKSGQIVAGVVIAVVFLALLASRNWSNSDESLELRGENATGLQIAQSPPALDIQPVAPAPPADSHATTTSVPEDAKRPVPSASVPGSVSVVTAQLCSDLSADWRCAPAANPTNPGRLFFYTRVRAPKDADMEHRWYYEGRLLQTVPLRVGANQGPGYRTYSRNTITAERPGAWTIEVRSQNGTGTPRRALSRSGRLGPELTVLRPTSWNARL